MNESHISLCYAGNKAVFDGLLLSALSAAAHTNRPLDVHVLTMDLRKQKASYLPFSQNQMCILERALRRKNADSRVTCYDLTELYLHSANRNKNAKNKYTPYAQLRLFLSELKGIPDKVLYLDVDTMCAGDIAPLFDTDIEGYEYAACVDPICKYWIDPHYCNSGVLLLNMPAVRESKLFERVRQLMCERHFAMPDQSALHKLGQRRLYLPRKYNEQSRRMREDTVIKHFCQGIKFYFILPLPLNIKQWQRERVHKTLKIFTFDDIYAEYDRLAAEFDLHE